jgi:hypothetical protein
VYEKAGNATKEKKKSVNVHKISVMKSRKKMKTWNWDVDEEEEDVDVRGRRGRVADCGMRRIALIQRLLSFGVWSRVVWYKPAEVLTKRAAYVLE